GEAGHPLDEDLLGAVLFQTRDLGTLAIEQIKGDLFLHLDHDALDRLAMRRELDEAHDVDRHAFGRLDLAGAVAVRAVVEDTALERWADALAGHLDDAELGDLQDLGAGAIALDGVAHGLLDATAMLLVAHVDEVVDDHATQVAQPQLAGDLPGGLQVHL